MPVLSKELAEQYDDPHNIFHVYSSNIPHLNSWIDELVDLTKKSSYSRDVPTTEVLVEFTQRYNAVFKELLRQTAVFNLPLSQLVAKAWSGNLKLLDHMIKTYHKHVRETNLVKGQAQQVMREKQTQEASVKNREEESVLERTVLRARIRGLEAEMEAMKIIQNRSNNENRYLRLIVDEYIRSSDANGRFAELMTAAEHSAAATRHHHHKAAPKSPKSQDDAPNFNAVVVGFGRKDTIEAGRVQLRELNRIEKEMNSILGAISKEEDRQRLIVQDLRKLVQKNPALFGKDAVTVAGGKAGINMAADTLRGGVARPANVVDVGCQVDEKDAMGVLNDLDPEMTGIVLAPSLVMTTTNSSGEPAAPAAIVQRKERLARPPPNITFLEKETTLLNNDGSHIPYKLRRLMRHFPKVQRLPPIEWLMQTIMSIYVSKIVSDLTREAKCLRRLSLAESIYQYYIELYGIGTVTDVQLSTLVAACEFHRGNVNRVTLFAHQLGLFDKEAEPTIDERDTQFILLSIKLLIERGQLTGTAASSSSTQVVRVGTNNIGPNSTNNGGGGGGGGGASKEGEVDEETDVSAPVDGLVTQAEEEDDDNQSVTSMTASGKFPLAGISEKVGVDQLLLQATASPNEPRVRHRRRSSMIPIMKVAVDWAAIRVGITFVTEIGRAEAVDVCKTLFEDMLTEGESLQGLSECIIKLKSMQGVGADRDRMAKGKASKHINMDEFLMVLMDPWDQHVRRPWRDHMQFLFKQHCVCFKVIQEASFASDTVAWEKDAVLNEVSSANAKECIRRPLRPLDAMVAVIAQQQKQHAAADAALLSDPESEAPENIEDADDAALGADSRIGVILRRRRQQEHAFAMLSRGDPKKGAVSELLTLRGFHQVVKMVNPTLTDTQVDNMFEDAIARSHEVVLRALERVWRPLYMSSTLPPRLSKIKSDECDKVFYVNLHARTTQWNRPFRLRTFHCQDVDIEDFVATILHHDCFARSPLMELFRIRPSELWPNIDIFAKQLEIKQQTTIRRNIGSVQIIDSDSLGYGGVRGAIPTSTNDKPSTEVVTVNAANAATEMNKKMNPKLAGLFSQSFKLTKTHSQIITKDAMGGTMSGESGGSESETGSLSMKFPGQLEVVGEDGGQSEKGKSRRKSKGHRKKSNMKAVTA